MSTKNAFRNSTPGASVRTRRHVARARMATSRRLVSGFDEQFGSAERVADAARVHGIFRVSGVADQGPARPVRAPKLVGKVCRPVEALDSAPATHARRDLRGKVEGGEEFRLQISAN